MEQVAPDVFAIKLAPRWMLNAYVIGDVLIDAGARQSKRTLLRVLRKHPVTAHALTHAHADHQGSSHAICTEFDIPLWCGRGDVEAMESGDIVETYGKPDAFVSCIQRRFVAGPAHPVDRALHEGDVVAGFEVLEVPGHSPGHIAFWRESDGVLIAGDVLNGAHLLSTAKGLHEPPDVFTPDAVLNRRSARRLAALEPKVVLFGHGPPWTDTDRFVEFVEQLSYDVPSSTATAPLSPPG